TAMNIPVAPAHRAQARTKISARHIEERFTESRAPGLIANERREDIVLLQEDAASHAHRFLAFAEVNAAGNQAAPVKARELIFKNPRLEHDAERFEVFLMRRSFRFGSAAF